MIFKARTETSGKDNTQHRQVAIHCWFVWLRNRRFHRLGLQAFRRLHSNGGHLSECCQSNERNQFPVSAASQASSRSSGSHGYHLCKIGEPGEIHIAEALEYPVEHQRSHCGPARETRWIWSQTRKTVQKPTYHWLTTNFAVFQQVWTLRQDSDRNRSPLSRVHLASTRNVVRSSIFRFHSNATSVPSLVWRRKVCFVILCVFGSIIFFFSSGTLFSLAKLIQNVRSLLSCNLC